MKKLIREAERQGWIVRKSKGNHFVFICPTCERQLIAGNTFSDKRGLVNHIAMMRNHGFSWQGRFREHFAVSEVGA